MNELMSKTSTKSDNLYSKVKRKRSVYKSRSRRRSSHKRKNRSSTSSSEDESEKSKTGLLQKVLTWCVFFILAYLVYSVITAEDIGELIQRMIDAVRVLMGGKPQR